MTFRARRKSRRTHRDTRRVDWAIAIDRRTARRRNLATAALAAAKTRAPSCACFAYEKSMVRRGRSVACQISRMRYCGSKNDARSRMSRCVRTRRCHEARREKRRRGRK
jgi:hypothetical protein